MTPSDAAQWESVLRMRLGQACVRAVVHPGIDPDDVCQVFLLGGDPVYACTVVSLRQARKVRAHTPAVLERPSFQVAAADSLTLDQVRAALDTWVRRGFPDLPPPRFDVLPGDGLDAPPQASDDATCSCYLERLRRPACVAALVGELQAVCLAVVGVRAATCNDWTSESVLRFHVTLADDFDLSCTTPVAGATLQEVASTLRRRAADAGVTAFVSVRFTLVSEAV